VRKVVYSVAMSLDGYIAGPNGEFDWIPMDPTVDWGAFMGRFDTVLLGRKTFEITAGKGSPGMRNFVFSRTLRQDRYPKVTVVSEGAREIVEGLRREEGKAIWLMGGGLLFQSLLEAGQVDGVEVAVVPILLGCGPPMLPASSRSVRLSLTKTHTYPSGIVALSYDVQRGSS
jgi:dihydrofolate reductase